MQSQYFPLKISQKPLKVVFKNSRKKERVAMLLFLICISDSVHCFAGFHLCTNPLLQLEFLNSHFSTAIKKAHKAVIFENLIFLISKHYQTGVNSQDDTNPNNNNPSFLTSVQTVLTKFK